MDAVARRRPSAQKAIGLPEPVSLKAISPGRLMAYSHSARRRMVASAHCCRSRVPTSMSMTAACTSWPELRRAVVKQHRCARGLERQAAQPGRQSYPARQLTRWKPAGAGKRAASVSVAAGCQRYGSNGSASAQGLDEGGARGRAADQHGASGSVHVGLRATAFVRDRQRSWPEHEQSPAERGPPGSGPAWRPFGSGALMNAEVPEDHA